MTTPDTETPIEHPNRPVRCLICRERMYYAGDVRHTHELRLNIEGEEATQEGYAHVTCWLAAVGYAAEKTAQMAPLYILDGAGFNTVGGFYLTELNGTFYLAVADRLYASEQSNPHRWNPLNYLLFDSSISGIGKDDTGLVVLTNNRAYRVTGTTPGDFVVERTA